MSPPSNGFSLPSEAADQATDSLTAQTPAQQLEADLNRQLAGLRLLSEVTACLLADQSPEALAATVFDRVTEFLDCDVFTHFQTDADGLRLIASAGIDEGMRQAMARLKIGQELCGEVAESGFPIYVPEVQHSSNPHAAGLREAGVRVYVGHPLFAGDQLLGTFAFASRRHDRFAPHQLEFIRSAAQAIATAMTRLRDAAGVRAREAKYRAAVETTADGFWVIDLEGRFLEVNAVYARRSGYSQEELLGMRITDVEAGESPAETTERINHVRTRGSSRFETLHRTKQGEIWPAEVSTAFWPEVDGRLFVYVRDLTGRKQAEKALRESEEQFRATFEQAAVGIAHVAPDGHFLRVNGRYAEITGYTPGEMLNLRFQDITHSAHLPVDLEQMTRMLAGDRPTYRTEKRYVRKSGESFWANVTVSLRRSETGEPLHFISVVEDISSRKQAEDSLRESEERLRVTLRAAGAVAFVWDARSDLWTRYYSTEPALPANPGQPEPVADVRERIHPDDRSGFDARVAASLTGGTIYRNLYRVIRPDASVRWLEEFGILDRDANGAPLRLTGVSIDVTERRRTEQALLGHNRVLEHIAAGAKLTEALEEIVRLVEDQMPGSLCSVLLLEKETGRLRFGAGGSLPAAYNAAVDGVPVGPKAGSCGTAAFRGKPVAVTDIATDPLWDDYRSLALAHDLRSCLSVPILATGNVPGESRGSVLGTFAIYWREPREPDMMAHAIITGAERLARSALLAQAEGGEPLVPTTPLTPGSEFQNDAKPGEVVAAAAHLAEVAIERDHAEHAIRESEERFRNVLDYSPAAVYLKDLAGRYLFVNRRTAETLGVPQADWVGKTVRELLPADTATLFEQNDRHVLETLSPHQVEESAVLSDGRRVTFLSVQFPLFREQGQPYAICGISTDITDRKQAQEERDRLWNLSPDPLCVVGFDGSFKQLNPAWTRRLGWSHEELLGMTVGELVHPDDLPATIQGAERLGRGETLGGFENRYRAKDGNYHWFSWNAIPLPSSPLMLGIARDVTEEKKLAEQFRQAHKMEAIGQLAGGVAHDFNNLLTVINGYAEFLLTDVPADDPRRAPLTAIQDAGERAAGLTAQLLAFSRKAIVEPKILDLNQVVESAARLLRRLIGEDIRLATDLARDVARVKIDPGQLEQVVMNLAINSRDAMPRGGMLTLATRTLSLLADVSAGSDDPPPGRYAVLSVTDTGEGMSDEVRARIFEPFFTTKGVGKGTGLGLATVYGIVRQAGGTIRVESRVGRGATFRVLLPAVEDQTEHARARPDRTTPRGSETILLAEDEPGVRRLARLALEMQGYAVLEADSGVSAARVAADHAGTIHLLVTDVVMPDVGGRELAMSIRAARPGVRVLFMSGYTDDTVVRHGVEASEDAFLQKPFTPMSLARRVREVLDAS